MTDIIVPEQQLTAIEQSALHDLEATIQTGLETFVEVGNALAEIRDKRLYRGEFSTFEDYCNTRWGFSRSRASRLINAAQVVNLLPIGNNEPAPANEAQARPLAKLTPERRAEAWQKAVATAPQGEVTAEHVQKIVDEMRGLSGRFDNKFFYWVDAKNEVIYNRAEKDRNRQWNRDNRFDDCTLVEGKELNRDKLYDSFPLVDPVEPVGPDMETVITQPSTANPWSIYYPLNTRKKILYLDPHNETERRKALRYRGCTWLTWSDMKSKWRSYTIRLCEYDLQPPEPAIPWQTDNPSFGPGARAVCDSCKFHRSGPNNSKIITYAYEQWTPSEKARVWYCPKGHLIDDLDLQVLESVIEAEIVEAEDLPTNEIDADAEDPDLDLDEDEDFEEDLEDDEDEDLGEADEDDSSETPAAASAPISHEQTSTPSWLTYVEHLSELVAAMKGSPEAIENALTADSLKAYEEQWGPVSAITSEGVEAAWVLLALYRPLPDEYKDIGLAKIQTFSPTLASSLILAMQENERMAKQATESLSILIDSYGEARKSLTQATDLLRQFGYSRINGEWKKSNV